MGLRMNVIPLFHCYSLYPDCNRLHVATVRV